MEQFISLTGSLMKDNTSLIEFSMQKNKTNQKLSLLVKLALESNKFKKLPSNILAAFS